MALAPSLTVTLRARITLEPFLSEDGYGKPTYGAAVTYRARIVGRAQMIRDDRGREVVSSKQVRLADAVAVSTKDRITLPAGEVPQQPPILAVGAAPDDYSRSATMLYLGGAAAGRA